MISENVAHGRSTSNEVPDPAALQARITSLEMEVRALKAEAENRSLRQENEELRRQQWELDEFRRRLTAKREPDRARRRGAPLHLVGEG